MSRADEWREQGSYFSWSPRSGDAAEVQIFHVELGDPDAPPLVLVHGFPTSSIDWFEVAERLSDRYRVCAMDFPGYGFSDKPLGWGYSLMRDAEVLEHYVADVLGLESMIMLAHDRGSSVAMIHTTSGDSRVDLEHLFLTNANIFLPLSNLTQAQRIMLDPETGPALLAQATPEQLAVGMGQATYTPPRGADDPEIQALAAIFSHGEGLKVLHETIQYLVERSQDEDSWLKALAALDVPTTFIWGVYDTVSPPRVVSYVWNEYMMKKPGRNSLYFIPDANHYLQNDQPDALVETFLHALEAPDDTPPGAIAPRLASPLLVDRSRSEAAASRRPPEEPGLSQRSSARSTGVDAWSAPDLDQVAVGVAHVAADLGLMVLRWRQELVALGGPLDPDGLDVGDPDVEEAADPIGFPRRLQRDRRACRRSARGAQAGGFPSRASWTAFDRWATRDRPDPG